MNKNVKLVAAAFLASTVLFSYTVPGFAVGSKYPYTSTSKKTSTYKPAPTRYTPPIQTYTTPAYTAPSYNSDYTQSYGQTYNGNNLPPLQGRVITVPAGTNIDTNSYDEISTEFVTVGDTVSVNLGSDLYYGGNVALPANSRIEGNVVLAEKAGMAGKNGKLKIHFTNAVTPNGQRIPLSGKIATEDGSGLLIGGTNTERVAEAVKQSAMGAGLGALFGTVMAPISGGKVGKGAYMGTAVGGGLGLLKSGIDKGNNVVIPANGKIDIMLDQPLTVTPGAAQSNGY